MAGVYVQAWPAHDGAEPRALFDVDAVPAARGFLPLPMLAGAGALRANVLI